MLAKCIWERPIMQQSRSSIITEEFKRAIEETKTYYQMNI